MTLKPQDLLVVLGIVTRAEVPWSYASLALTLGMSPSEVHAAVKRATRAGLLGPDGKRANRSALLEFLLHGLRYVFVPDRGGVTRGVPTAHSAPPLQRAIAAGELPVVWPDPEGTVRGESLEPLYRSVPRAARNDPKLHEVLALVDALRCGRARERKLAEQHLRGFLS